MSTRDIAIYIACYRWDYYLTRICVASIRFFYPDIDIYLVKDNKSGKFNSRILEKYWNVKIYPTKLQSYGWGLSKLEVCFDATDNKIFVMDSDIVFVGTALDQGAKMTEDIVISPHVEEDPSAPWIQNVVYDYEKLKNIDPDFTYPGFVFNTGNFFTNRGVMKRSDFSELVQWYPEPRLLQNDVFQCADQGIINYVTATKMKNEEIRVGNYEFMYWSQDSRVASIDLKKIKKEQGEYPFLIHWAGSRNHFVGKMQRADILRFFELQYYAALPFGSLIKLYDKTTHIIDFALIKCQKIVRRFIKITKKIS